MNKLLPLGLVIAVGILLLSSVFHPGYMHSHDSLWHVERFMNMRDMLVIGQFPVRWSANLDDGYGIPLFNFTYPLPYYLGGSLMLLGLGPIKVYNLILLLTYLVGGVGYFLLGKGGSKGVVTSLIYLMSPYVFLDIFVRGALGEFMAMSLFPWALLSLQKVCENNKLRWYSPIPLALLLLSHNFYGLLLLALLLFWIFTTFNKVKFALLSVLISIGLSSFFLIPSLAEKQFLAESTNGFNYEQHFVYPRQLLYSKWSYIGSFPGADPTEMSFQLGLANWLIIGLAIILGVVYRPKASKLIWLLIPLLVSLFLTLPESDFVWQMVPILQTIQFPWRFIGIATVIVPLLYLVIANMTNKKLLLVASVLVLVIGFYNVRNYRRPVEWFDEPKFLEQHYLYKDRTTTAHRWELVPRWAAAERFIGAPGLVIGNNATINNIIDQELKVGFTAVAANSGTTATVYRNYYPSWRGEVDGERLVLSPSVTGEIVVPLEEGTHNYMVYVGSTAVAILGSMISLLSIAGIIYLWRKNG